MTKVDAVAEMRDWFSSHQEEWVNKSIVAQLRLPDSPELNKAVTTFETPTHVGSLTAWGGGTVEFIVLEIATKNESIVRDGEYADSDELRRLLDEYSNIFVQTI